MYLRSKDIPGEYTPKKNPNFQTIGVLFSLCKLGVEITCFKFKIQEMAEMLFKTALIRFQRNCNKDWLC